MYPLISVIVPVYNSEKYLSRCIESILNQTYSNIELILINDGSTDNSPNICEEFQSIDSRIQVLHKVNGGVSSARNAGIDLAKGSLVGFVDSDDHISEEMYARLFDTFSDDVDLATLVGYTVNSTELTVDEVSTISNMDALGYIFKLRFPTSLWAYLYKKDAIGDLRLDESIHFFEDFVFNVKVLKRAKCISLCKENLYHYEMSEGSINLQKINDKKVSCLKIYDDLIDEPFLVDDGALKSKAEYFRAHFLAGTILTLSNSIDVAEKKYYDIVKEHARSTVVDTLRSRHVPIKYKMAIAASAVSPLVTAKIIKTVKKL